MRLIAYGNFRLGQPLSKYLDDLRMEGETEVIALKGIRMHAAGQAPAVIITDDQEDQAIVEIIEADIDGPQAAELLKLLDVVEGVEIGLYRRSLVKTPKGWATIYEFSRSVEGLPIIEDWAEWTKLSPEEKLETIKSAKGSKTRLNFVSLQ